MRNLALMWVLAACLLGCGGMDKDAKDKADPAADTVAPFTDTRDGKVYKIVKIGSQIWFAENLNFAAEGSKCYGEDGRVWVGRYEMTTISTAEVEANCTNYGRLYNWETALKACPAGYHLPSADEWEALVDYVGGEEMAGTKLKSAAGWNEDGNGMNDYGFSALPGGNGFSVGGFGNTGDYGYWWSATESGVDGAWYRYMEYDNENVGRDGNYKTGLLSVRCVADKEGEQ